MKKILLCFLITLFSASLKAQTSLVVNPPEPWQKTYSYPLSDIRELSFHDGKMNIALISAGVTKIPLSEIAELRFDSQSDITTAGDLPETELFYDRRTQNLKINCDDTGVLMCIYSIDGRLCMSMYCHNSADIDVAHLAPGVYVAVTGRKSFKFAK